MKRQTLIASASKPAAPAALLSLLGASLLFVVGCGSEQAVSLGPAARTHTNHVSTTTTTTAPASVPFEVWFARSDGLVAVERSHAPTPAVATAAIEALLAGPSAAERAAGLGTAIPAGTKLLGISLHDGVATIDLTSEYEAGGGSLSMQLRLGQVVYTLTEFPTVKKVLFHLDGAPVDVFSSEGIVLGHPVGRSDYVDLLPAITVGRPGPGTRVSSPATVSGSANVFEANVSVEVLDHNGTIVGKTFTTATCGTGCRGTYSVSVPFRVTAEQPGTIVVHDDDAAGTGTPPHTVRVPVVLAP
jgi:hypothetical protein